MWRDLAVALRHAVMELQDKVPPNPNQVQDRPEVAEYERKYQERQRKAREQQQGLAGGGSGSGSSSGGGEQRLGGEPALMSAHDEQQQQGQHTEQQWQRQQEQLMAVIRRISAAHQLEHEWVVDLDLQEGQQPHQHHHQHQQGDKQQHSAAWRDQLQRRWAQGQHILHTWQHMQDRQVSYLLARSRAAAARGGAASSGADGGSAGGSSQISVSGSSVSSSGSSSVSSQRKPSGDSWPWSIGPWLPFLSSSDGADSS